MFKTLRFPILIACMLLVALFGFFMVNQTVFMVAVISFIFVNVFIPLILATVFIPLAVLVFSVALLLYIPVGKMSRDIANIATKHNLENFLIFVAWPYCKTALLSHPEVKLKTIQRLYNDKKLGEKFDSSAMYKLKHSVLRKEFQTGFLCSSCKETGSQLLANGFEGWAEDLNKTIINITKCSTCIV